MALGINPATEGTQGSLPLVQRVLLKKTELQGAVTVGGTRRIWQIIASAQVGRIQKKINAVWDVKVQSQHRPGLGGFLYWREE
jgi:hypothetical protein